MVILVMVGSYFHLTYLCATSSLVGGFPTLMLVRTDSNRRQHIILLRASFIYLDMYLDKIGMIVLRLSENNFQRGVGMAASPKQSVVE